jgi:methylated-DNA-[protein]-cysteine S-methyltransferase
MHYTFMDSPVGRMLLSGDENGIHSLFMPPHGVAPKRIGDPAPLDGWVRDDRALREAQDQLQDYFDGGRTAFDLPLAPEGTAFQQRVWARLREIPYACTTTYGAVARSIGAPNAVRAVGAAVGRNPISIIVPCHRVVGAGGSLTGFAGGLDNKKWLLGHERASQRADVLEQSSSHVWSLF